MVAGSPESLESLGRPKLTQQKKTAARQVKSSTRPRSSTTTDARLAALMTAFLAKYLAAGCF